MSSPYQVPRQPGRWRAIALAVVVHMALLAFLWFGISWQSQTPLTVEAEIWDPTVKEAAPLPQPEPEPEPPKPTPEPVPEPVKPPPPPKVEEPPVVKPDIALEKEKEKKRKEAEKKDREEKAKEAKLEREKEDQLKKEKQEKLDADKKLAKQKEDAEAKKKAEADKLAAEKKQKQQAADNKAAEQRRQDDLKRMMGQATSNSGGTGTAAKSQGPIGAADYGRKLGAKIRSNTIFDVPGELSANPAVEYTVELLPDGTVRSIRKNRTSGIPGFDEAVLQAINKSQPFPPDKDGRVPNSFTFTHLPKDQ
ncbi:cell envelope integrity protein TolA [Herbaspirillum rhizosphaerae]|uniref:cell envelope integrity protein TolA n=1 Tax=Herbaspirillum rhizosphaerae TaxID=346179 RepID=UPI00067BE95E|nr:cell envelope integrity protein TolA [Herbaspirillum rhizosphaerae]